MATNADIIALAKRIAAIDATAGRFRRLANKQATPEARDDLMRTASSLDDDLCQLCTDMRLACYEPSEADRAIASLPDCVAAAMLGHEDESDAWTDKEIL